MRYLGHFIDLRSQNYSVEIDTPVGTGEEQIKLSPSPVIVEIESNEVFKPVKYSTLSLKLLANKVYSNLFAAQHKTINVAIKKDDEYVWRGYLRPAVFSQTIPEPAEEFELEAIDGLSVLERERFNLTGFVSLAQIVWGAILATGINYSYIRYFSSSNKTLTSLKICAANFYDEDGEPMTWQQALEEVCRFMKYTCIAVGDEIWLIDYDYLKAKDGNISYASYKYNAGQYVIETGTVLTKNLKLNLGDYTIDANPQISIEDVYDKIAFRSSMYEREIVINEMFDSDILTYKDSKQYTKTSGIYNYTTRLLVNPNYAVNASDSATITNFNSSFIETIAENTEDNTIDESNTLCCSLTSDLRRQIALTTMDHSLFGYGSIVINMDLLLTSLDFAAPHLEDEGESLGGLICCASLRIGEHYWNGAKWIKNPDEGNKVFNLVFPQDGKRGQWLTVNDESFANSVPGEKGYVIPTMSEGGDVEFKIYAPVCQTNYDKMTYAFIRNFSCKYVKHPLSLTAGESISAKNEEDILYEIVVDESNYSKLDDITLNITSRVTGKARAMSSVFEDVSLRLGEQRTDSATGLTDRHENILLRSYVTQYKEPRIRLDLAVNHLIPPISLINDDIYTGHSYIIDSISIDYAMCNSVLSIVQKV